MDNIILLPAPRRVAATGGSLRLPADGLILLQSSAPQVLRFAAGRVQSALEQYAGVCWEITASPFVPAAATHLTLRLGATPEGVKDAQGYTLSIRPDGITISAGCTAGVFYGACTLTQIIEQAGASRSLPCLEIVDWPDFPVRGVMLDISRDKVPTMATLYGLVDMLAGWKVNQFQLYTEHTFAYRNHPEVWAAASPLTGQEILDLDAYCRARHVDLVPNQNSFGHLERWLRHPRYTPLAEVLGDVQTPWGSFRGPFSLSPGEPASLDLLRSLYDELLPHFTSRLFNVGCDETWDLGQGRSRQLCQDRGAARVYLDFLLQIQREVQARNHVMQFWGDIVIQHPELLPPELAGSVALEWGYEANHPFEQHGSAFASAGLPFYVCPGTSSWNSIAGRTDNALANLRSAAEDGLRQGAIGYLNTDWGDRGHWQTLPVSYLGFAAGAAYSWDLAANGNIDLAHAVSWHAFRDPTGNAGRAAYDLGNVYRAAGVVPDNASALFQFLAERFDKLRPQKRYATISAADFGCAEEAIADAVAPLANARMAGDDVRLLRQEFALAEHMLRHACRRGLLYLAAGETSAPRQRFDLDQDLRQIMTDYQVTWLARNRPGGLIDSTARLEHARQDYREDVA